MEYNIDKNKNINFEDIVADSSQKMRYNAQVDVLKKQIGDLEEIRAKLGLSQRKICQLLMVDPSAWTRWTKYSRLSNKKKAGAPPHIYRALQWYLALQTKIPGLTNEYFLNINPNSTDSRLQLFENEISDLKTNLTLKDQQILKLRSDIQKYVGLVFMLIALLGFVLIFLTIKQD